MGKTEYFPTELLPTPTSNDMGGGRINKSLSPGAKPRPTIAKAASMGILPTPQNGEKEETSQGSRQLNPLYVEEMMGFPSMWTTLPFLKENGEKNP